MYQNEMMVISYVIILTIDYFKYLGVQNIE